MLLALEILMQCAKESPLKLKFIKAEIIPIFDSPSQLHTYSGLDSMKMATTSSF